MELIYGEGDANFSQIHYGFGNNANYNGNITMMKWSGASSDLQVYGFVYDELNRVTSAIYGLQNSPSNYNLNHTYTSNYSYSDNGNILTIDRNTIGGVKMDDMMLDYTPEGRLKSIIEIGDRAQGFITQNSDNTNYDFDLNGNLTKDPDKRLKMGYNYLNLQNELLPYENGPTLIEWLYDAVGTKLQKKVIVPDTLRVDADTIVSRGYLAKQLIISEGKIRENSEVEFKAGQTICLDAGFEVELGAEFLAETEQVQDFTRDYCNAIEYKDGEIEAVYHEAGRVIFDSGNAEFQFTLADHLNNTRILFRNDGNGNAEVLGEWSYFPFGLLHEGVGSEADTPKMNYKYANKEHHTDFGLNLTDFGNRCQDPATGRFTTIDRFAEKYYSMSPFSYGANNPSLFIDITGDSLWISYQGINIRYQDGNLYDSNGNQYMGKGTKVKKDGTIKYKCESLVQIKD